MDVTLLDLAAERSHLFLGAKFQVAGLHLAGSSATDDIGSDRLGQNHADDETSSALALVDRATELVARLSR